MKYYFVKSLTLPFAVLSAFAVAEDRNSAEIYSVVISADKLGPQSETSGSRDILVRQPQSVGDILKNIPGVQAGHPSALGQRFKIRGMEDQFINVTIDGARQEGYHFHHSGSYGIDPDILKRVDIDVGINSITYDSGALGGSVKFETVDASDLLKKGKKFGAKTKLGYASNGREFQKSLTMYGKMGAFDLLGYVNHRNMDDYKSGKYGGHTEQIPNNGHLLDYMFKGKFNFNDEQYIKLTAEKYHNTAETNTRLNFGVDINQGDKRKYEVDRDTYSIVYGFLPVDNDWVNLKVEAYSNKQISTHMKNLNGNGGTDTIVKTQGIKLRNKSLFDMGNLNHTLTAGFEYYDSKSSIDNNLYNNTTLEQGKSTALYLEDKIRFNKLTITPGIRWDHYKYDSFNGKYLRGGTILAPGSAPYERSYSHVSKALGLKYDITPNFATFTNYTELFRGPSGKDLGIGYSENNQNLKATTGHNIEVGISSIGSDLLISGDGLSLTAKVFQTTYDDFVTVLSKRKLDNIPKARLRGGELSLGYQSGPWNANFSYSKVDNKIVDGNNDFIEGAEFEPSVGDTFILGLSYEFVKQSVELGWNTRLVKAKSSYGYDGKGALPVVNVHKQGYGVSDLYIAWAPKSNAWNGLDIVFGIDNIFNKKYNDQSYYLNTSQGQAEKGRNIKLTASYMF